MSQADESPSSSGDSAGQTTGRFAYDGLERAIHERARLGILTSLIAHPGGLLFNDLKELCALTDGNLSRHLKVLQEAGLVEVWKGQKQKRPQTLCRLTVDGRQRFLQYLGVLEKVISDAEAAAAQRPANAAQPTRYAQGWSPA